MFRIFTVIICNRFTAMIPVVLIISIVCILIAGIIIRINLQSKEWSSWDD